MNFPRPLPWLLLPAALTAGQAPLQGGGSLTLGHAAYRFIPKDLALAEPKGGLPGALRIKGELVPEAGGPVYALELVVLRDGRLYLMSLRRGQKGQYPDTWAATLSTRVKLLALEDHPGGRVELEVGGRLTGVVDRKAISAPWQGRLWAVFPEPETED
jgi:hypothetical protein